MTAHPPAMSTLQSMTPPALDHVVTTCLAKTPDDRWQSAGDVGRQLTWITGGGSQPSVSTDVAAVPLALPRPVWRRTLPVFAGAVAASIVTGVMMSSLMRSPVPQLRRFAIPPPAPETVVPGVGLPDIAISPDGSRVVYLATLDNRSSLYVRALDELVATPLHGLDLGGAPFISPDSAWVGFYDGAENTLKKIPILGGPSITIGGLVGEILLGASWGADDTIIFGTINASGLWRVSSNGGEPEELTPPDADQANHIWPHILPGGRAVLFTILTGRALESAQIAVLDLDTNELRVLVPRGSNPHYSPTGHIVYGVSGTLRAVGFDLNTLDVTDSNPVPVLDGVITKPSGAANFDIARDGSLVYVAGQGAQLENTLAWVDRQGREEAVAVDSRPYYVTRISPDGTAVALDVRDQENTDLWLYDFAAENLQRLTDSPGIDGYPVWTNDGLQIIWSAAREGGGAIYSGVRRMAQGRRDAWPPAPTLSVLTPCRPTGPRLSLRKITPKPAGTSG